MEHQEQLKSFLQDLINDRPEQAEVTIHNYIVAKTQALSGLGAQAPAYDESDDEATEE